MRKVTLIGISLLVLLTGLFLSNQYMHSEKETSNLFSYWKTFEPSSGKFKVSFPSKPQYMKDLVDIPDSSGKRLYEIYVSEKVDGTIFMVSVITYPTSVASQSPKDILKGMLDELVQGRTGSKLSSIEEAEHKSNIGYNFNIDNGELKTQGKTFYVNQSVYILSYITKQENINPEEYDFFMNSFELLDSNYKNKTQ